MLQPTGPMWARLTKKQNLLWHCPSATLSVDKLNFVWSDFPYAFAVFLWPNTKLSAKSGFASVPCWQILPIKFFVFLNHKLQKSKSITSFHSFFTIFYSLLPTLFMSIEGPFLKKCTPKWSRLPYPLAVLHTGPIHRPRIIRSRIRTRDCT